MKLLWTWVQSAKWPLKTTRKQANRRLFREQWPRQKVQGQKGEGVLWTKRRLEWRIQPSELRRSTQSNSFPKAWPLRGHRSTKLKEGRKFMDFWVRWVLSPSPPSCPCALAARSPWHQTQPRHDHSLPWTWRPWASFFSSWLVIPEVSAGPVLGAASVPELNCTPVAGFLSTF